MNPILTTVGAVAAVAKVASTAYYYAEHFGVLNRESKADQAETRSVEAAEKQSADVGFLLSRIPVFHGSGYEIWSSMMKTFFVSQDLWDMVEGGYVEEELTVEVLQEVQKKDAMVLFFIQQAIDQSFFSCIAGARKSKEAWDALANKYQGPQGDVLELNQQSPVDLSCPADAIESREEARDALEVESRGYTDEPNRKKAVDELVLSYAADATDPKEVARDAPEQGNKANTKVLEANRIGVEFGDFNRNCGFKEWCSSNSDSGWGGGSDDRHVKMSYSDNSTPVAESAFHSKLKLSEDGIGKESGDVKNNNSGSKKGSNRGGRGGRNCGRFNNNRGGRGGRDGECSNNQGFHGGTENGDFNNSPGGRGGQGSGHINNNRGGRGGRGSGHINNNRGGRGGKGRGHINNKRGGRGGKDHGHFNNGSEAAEYYSKNAKSESASSCTTSATETKEALDAHALQQGHQANTEVHAHSQVSQSLTTLLVCDLDVNVTDRQLFSIFGRFGQVVSYSVCRDMASQCSLGYGYVTYGNPQDAALVLTVTNLTMNGKPIRVMYLQQDSTEHKSGGLNSKKSDYGGMDGAHSNNNQGGRVGTDGGCFNNKDSKLSGYTSKNPNFESVSSCSTDAIESKEASDAPQLGHQANTEVKDQAQVGNPSGGTIFIKNLDWAIDDVALHAMFSAFGNILSCKVETDASGQSKGYGRIEYDSEEAAREAIEKANGSKLLNGKKMYVEPFVRKQGRAKAMETTNFTNVFVGNLSVSTTEKDLREVFGNFGTIVNAVVVKDGDGKSEGFGFVNFNDAYDAAWSVDVLNGRHEFDNKVWYVRRAYQNKNVGKAQKKFNGKAQKKCVDESVPSSTAKATESKKSGDTVSQKKCNGKAQKKYVPSSTTNETESKKAVEAVQKGFRANTKVLYVDDKGVGHFKLKNP